MQSKKMSMLESAVSTAIGYSVATAANYYILPLFGYAVTLADASWIGVIFTLISLVRGYFVRRFFNWIHMKRACIHGQEPRQCGICHGWAHIK